MLDPIHAQIALLREGRPLEAFDTYFDESGVMYANDVVFAIGAAQGRQKQLPFFTSAVSIKGVITDVVVSENKGQCAFRNKTVFVTKDDRSHQIDGLCWQSWGHGKIVEERYYDGDSMWTRIREGILTDAEISADIRAVSNTQNK